jgi:HEAT repeat protein
MTGKKDEAFLRQLGHTNADIRKDNAEAFKSNKELLRFISKFDPNKGVRENAKNLLKKLGKTR